MNDKISIIIPIYNVEKYLCNALMRGMIILVKGYSHCRMDDGAKERYKELKELYRKIAKNNFFQYGYEKKAIFNGKLCMSILCGTIEIKD